MFTTPEVMMLALLILVAYLQTNYMTSFMVFAYGWWFWNNQIDHTLQYAGFLTVTFLIFIAYYMLTTLRRLKLF